MSDRPERVLSAARLALAIRNFTEERPEAAMLASEPIAIVGIGCRLPGDIRSPEDCWRALHGSMDGVAEVPPSRWPVENYYDLDPMAPGKTNGRWGGFVSDPALFDPALFGISPREAATIDPQQRLLLEVAREAIEDSGRSPESLGGSRTGVFIGIGMAEYERLVFSDTFEINSNACTGTYHSVASGRISYLFDLRGPSTSVDTACSSSLVAVHLACQSLRSGESDLALAGGVALHLLPDHYVALAKLGMLSPDGRCKAFDAGANGFVPSEGCGLVVLKRLSDALADGDRTYAVIRGTATNQDGRTNTLTAPNGLAQREVILAALGNAQVPPASISYVETHGTGTALGDPIEVEALAAALGTAAGGNAHPCALGAAKTNFGHLEAAAGVTGLIKTALALHHEEIPANLHFERLSPHISLEGTRFFIPTSPVPWPRGPLPRFAGVSSFGFSGTNAHVTIEESPQVPVRPRAESRGDGCVLTISARSADALKDAARQIRIFLSGVGREIPLPDICHTAALRRSHHEERLALTAGTHEQMCRLIDEFLERRHGSAWANGRASRKPESTVFVFSGQGSQWPGMGVSLLRREPVFRAALEECEEWIGRWAGWSLIGQLSASEAESKLADTEYAQPAIFAIDVAVARLFESWGVLPSAVIGHSAGEVAAVHIAGVLSLGEATRIVVNRGRLMQTATGKGKMAVVRLAATAVVKELARHRDAVSVAAINGPQSTVISGDSAAVDELFAMWRERGIGCILMTVNYAFHSAQMDPFQEELVRMLGTVKTSPGKVPVISTVLGRMTPGSEFNAAYWGRNIRHTVQLAPAVDAAFSMGLETFLEIGPHPVLTGSIRECIEARDHLNRRAIPTLRRNSDDRTAILSAVGALYAAGCPISWQAVYREPAPAVALPPYPYQRQRFWLVRQAAIPGSRRHPLVGKQLRSPCILGAAFEAEIGLVSLPYLADHAMQGVVLLPMAAFLEMAQQAAYEHFGTVRALAGITVLEPLPLPKQGTVTAQVVIEGDLFRIHSLAGDRWKLHASGRIVEPCQPDGSREPAPACEFVDPESFYCKLMDRGMAFGPAFRIVGELAAGSQEAWATVRLAETERIEAANYRLHPALLDGCLQTVMAAAPNDGGLFLPFAVDRFECLIPAVSEARAYARLTPAAQDVLSANVDIRNADGQLVARIEGVHLKRRVGTQGGPRIYKPEWRLTPGGAPVLQEGGRSWVVLSDSSVSAAKLTEGLSTRGLTAKLIDAEKAVSAPIGARGLIWLVDRCLSRSAEYALTGISGIALTLTQQLLRQNSPVPPQLWLVTQGAVAAVPTDTCDGVFQSPVWGMARTIAIEHPGLACVRVDLNPAAPDFEALAQEIANWDGEEEVAFRASGRWVPRLFPVPAARGGLRRWAIDTRGSVDNLALVPMERRTPGPGEVEVETECSALNFRDVLNVLGMYPGDAGNQPGLEFCGRVVRTGEGVSHYRAGDRVMGIAWGSFAQFATTPAALTVPVPEGYTNVAAATLPNSFLTAYHCLIHMGRLRRGERVLIHAAAGGVGIAAVQLAMHTGAEIFATASSPEKREYLRSLGVPHVFDSRSLDFCDAIGAATDGHGVDMVLNSLAGDWIDASFSALANGGRFIEIGKNRIWSAERVASLDKGIEYLIVDLAEQIEFDQTLIQAHLSRIRDLFEAGALRPLPSRVFPFEEAPAAFRYMSQAKHTGKIVLRHSVGTLIRADATYLITGGLGAIGSRLADWLVGRGARNLVLVGRKIPTPIPPEIDGLYRSGARIELRSADLTDRQRMDAIFLEIKQELPPLAGVLHAAGVLDDGIFTSQTRQRMEGVLAPKAIGAWNLHELTAGMPLDFFVMFSSVASLIGSQGQAGYAAANAFLDGLAHYRQARGLAGLSVNWGAWADSGMAANVNVSGRRRTMTWVRPMPARECLDRLEDAMAQGAPQVAIVDADWTQRRPAIRLLSELIRRPAERQPSQQPSLLHRLEATPERNRRKVLLEYLRGQIGSLLGLTGNEPVLDENEPLMKMGMDSLMAVEFRNHLTTTLGRPLSATLIFDHPTIGSLADLLGGNRSSKVSEQPDALLEETKLISEEEAEELLREELERR